MIIVLLLQACLHIAGGSTSWVKDVSDANRGDHSNGSGLGEGVGATSRRECISLDGQIIPHGDNYVPGPDYCSVCKCEEGKPRFCRAVLCQPPQNCKSFRVGKTCCDFICLDDILPKVPDNNGTTTTDLGLRMVASAITAILSLALLLFLIHRLRQRRLRAQQQYYEDQLDSPVGVGAGALGDGCHNNACCHNAAYCTANDHVDLFFETRTPPYALWKPPSFYFNYEDNPPPYSEVVGTSGYQSSSLGPLTVQLPRESSADQAPIGIASQASAVAGMAQAASQLGTLERRERVLRSDQIYEDNDQQIDILPNEPAPPYSTLLPSNHSRGPPQSPAHRSPIPSYTPTTLETQGPQTSVRRSPVPQYTLATLDTHGPQSPARRSPIPQYTPTTLDTHAPKSLASKSSTPQYVLSAANSNASPINLALGTGTDNAQVSPRHNRHMLQSDNIQNTWLSPVHNKQDNISSRNHLTRAPDGDGFPTREHNIDHIEEIGAVGGMSSSINICYMNGETSKKSSDSDTVDSFDPDSINQDDHADSHSSSQITTVRQRVRTITEKQQQQQQMSTLEDFRIRLTQDLSDSSLSSTTQGPTTQTMSTTSSSDDTSCDTFDH